MEMWGTTGVDFARLVWWKHTLCSTPSFTPAQPKPTGRDHRNGLVQSFDKMDEETDFWISELWEAKITLVSEMQHCGW